MLVQVAKVSARVGDLLAVVGVHHGVLLNYHLLQVDRRLLHFLDELGLGEGRRGWGGRVSEN